MSMPSDDYGDTGDSRTEELFTGVPAADYTDDPYFFTGDPDAGLDEPEPVGEFEADNHDVVAENDDPWVGVSGLPDN